jgi:hypothetical protein
LAVLIHHDTAAISATPAQLAAHSTHTGHAMPGTASSSATAIPQGSASAHAGGLDAPAPAHGVDGSTCADPGMQHCTTANVEVFQLLVPPQGLAAQTGNPYRAQPGPLPVGTVGRAPPDLSVLSQLRI